MFWRNRQYDVLPALAVRRSHLRQALRTVTVAWMYGVVWMACISGSQVEVFARKLGFDEFAFGLMGAIPFLARFGQPLAALKVGRSGVRKWQFLLYSVIHRLSWIGIAAIPLVLPIPSRAAVWSMLGILTLSWYWASQGQPAWTTWMGDLIPRRIRGRYFGVRSRLSQFTQIVAVVLVGVVLDYVEGHGTDRQQMWTMCVIFAVAAIFGTVDILLFLRIREVVPSALEGPAIHIDLARPRRSASAGQIVSHAGRMAVYYVRCLGTGTYQLLLEPLKDRAFLYFVGHGATLAFAATVGGWFFYAYCIEDVGLSNLATNLLFLVIGPLAAIAFSKIWGQRIDRWGRRPTLVLATASVCFSVFPYFFAMSDTPAPAFISQAVNALSAAAGSLVGKPGWHLLPPGAPVGAFLVICLAVLIGGSSWSGIGLAQTGISLGFSDRPGRAKYVAGSNVLIGIGGLLGGVAGGLVAKGLVYYHAHPIVVALHWHGQVLLGPFRWNNYHATFAMSILARAASLLWLIRMPDPGARSFSEMMRSIGAYTLNVSVGSVLYPLRWLRPEETLIPERTANPRTANPTSKNGKSEIRNTKSETNGKRQTENPKQTARMANDKKRQIRNPK